MKNKNAFTLIELMGIIIIMATISVMSFSAITSSIKKAENRDQEVMEEAVKRAAELYIETNRETFHRFSAPGDKMCVTAQELINATFLDSDIKIPKGGSPAQYKADAVIKQDNTITYTVVKGTCVYVNSPSTLMNVSAQSATSQFLDNPYLKRNQIESLEIKNAIPESLPDGRTWDVSKNKDGSVMAWYENGSAANLYKVYIAASGKVYASADSSYLFSHLTNLQSLNLSYLDTSNVTNMSYMFDNSTALTTITIGYYFDTSNVTKMNCMFYRLSNLTQIITLDGTNVINFNTNKLENMSYMFSNSKLKNLTFGPKFRTTKATNMSYMFSNMSSLEDLDIRHFDFDNNPTSTSFLASATPTNVWITVNVSGKNFVETKFTSYTNINFLQ